MQSTFAPPTPLAVVAAVFGAFLVAVLPTCLYLYVEPRGRMSWAIPGDTPDARRAPALVRLTAWLSFVIGQVALPWLVVPAACGALLLLQTKLGIVRPVGLAVTVAAGGAAVFQAALALRLLPLGVRLLVRHPAAASRATRVARGNAIASALVLALAVTLGAAMTHSPRLVHPWLRAALTWTALRPILGYAGLCLAHALLLGTCARQVASLGSRERGERRERGEWGERGERGEREG